MIDRFLKVKKWVYIKVCEIAISEIGKIWIPMKSFVLWDILLIFHWKILPIFPMENGICGILIWAKVHAMENHITGCESLYKPLKTGQNRTTPDILS